MPVILRQPNTPTPGTLILQKLAVILPGYPVPNTRLAATSVSQTGLEQIYVQSPYALSQGSFPAVLLMSGAQHYSRNSNVTYDGTLEAIAHYYDRWDRQQIPIEQVWANIDADLLRMQSNIESNESLAQGGVAYAVSIPHIALSPFEADLDEKTVPGLVLCVRTLSAHINILPYDATQ